MAYVGLGDLGSEFYAYKAYDNKWSKTLEFKGRSRKGAVTWPESFQFVGLGKADDGQYTKEMWEFIPDSRAK